jgi:8-oxo-dGTP pyrophosphatase MutT (NUDIX family)
VTELSNIGLDDIRKRLMQQAGEATSDIPYKKNGAKLKQAAVLMPFVRVEQSWHLLFIQRAVHERDRHSGQVAFAGGKREEDDIDLQATALREAHEEVGIDPNDVTVIGELGHHYSISDFQITPVVATVDWPYQLTLQSSEVAATFTIPLQWLANPENYEIKQREFNGQMHPVIYFKEYEGYLLWGATARMTVSLIALLQNN